MLKENTIKAMEDEAKKELEKLSRKGKNAEIVYVPVLIQRNAEGQVGCVTSYTGCIMQEENI